MTGIHVGHDGASRGAGVRVLSLLALLRDPGLLTDGADSGRYLPVLHTRTSSTYIHSTRRYGGTSYVNDTPHLPCPHEHRCPATLCVGPAPLLRRPSLGFHTVQVGTDRNSRGNNPQNEPPTYPQSQIAASLQYLRPYSSTNTILIHLYCRAYLVFLCMAKRLILCTHR